MAVASAENIFVDPALKSLGSVEVSPNSEFYYHALVEKVLGSITGRNFLEFTRRFVAICNEIYPGTIMELRKNKPILTSMQLHQWLHQYHRFHIVPDKGEAVDIKTLTEEGLSNLFMECSSVTLNLRPETEIEGLRSSFAQAQWRRRKPNKICFYAQDGATSGQGILVEALYRRMFHAPDSPAPRLNYMVWLGISEVIDKR